MRISLKNFQSHKSSELILGDFTVIVGHSSSGKSAIIRAVRTALYNLPSKSFIRKGAKKLEIELEIDADKIMYNRDASVSYQINGSELMKAVGRDQLKQIADLGFQPLDIDKKKYYPQISQQWDTPFLISFSDAEVSKILSALSQAGKIKSAKGKMLRDSQEMASTARLREIDRQGVQKQLTDLGDIEGQNNRLQGILRSQEELHIARKNWSGTIVLEEKIGLECEEFIPNIDKELFLRLKSDIECLLLGRKSGINAFNSAEKVLPKVSENFTLFNTLSKLYEVCSTPMHKVPDMVKMNKAIMAITRIDQLRSELINIGEDFKTLHYEAELALLETQIHKASVTCPACGQKKP